MAKGLLDQVVLLRNIMTIITEGNQIFIYLQWERNLLLIYHKKEKR